MTGLHTAVLALALTGAGTDEPILLDFSAPWCGPCRQMEPVIEELIAEGYPIKKLDFDSNRQLAARLGVDRIPSFVMTVRGRETDRIVGPASPERLKGMFAAAKRLAQPQAPPKPTRTPVQLASAKSTGRSIPLPARRAPGALPMESGNARVTPQPASNGEGQAGRVLPAVVYGSAQSRSSGLSDQELIAATVRIRVHDAEGSGCGSGTLIDSREGQALILTCGHLFRDYRDGGRIEVDLFGRSGAKTAAGRLLACDADRDVGLLIIEAPQSVETIPVAPPGHQVDVGALVANVGCSHGDDPTVRRGKVTARDRYEGPSNLEVAGRPVVGRSGGGLFSSDGFLVGVCNFADLEENKGIYAALPSIYEELDEASLSFVYDRKKANPVVEAPMVAIHEPTMPREMPAPDPMVQLTRIRGSEPGELVRTGVANRLTADEQRLLDELRRRRAEGAEIVCIIRTKESTDSKSEVFLFENASPQLIGRLQSEGFARR